MLAFILGAISGAIALMVYAHYQVSKMQPVQVQPKRLAAPYDQTV